MAAGLLAGAAGCARRAAVGPPPSSGPSRSAPAARHVEEGLATYYASKFSGRKTASGERYQPAALTAAHRTLPFGTFAYISRIDAAGRVVAGPVGVRINDRGPYSRRTVIIDLSYEVARRLGMLRDGVVRVRLEIP